MTRKLLLGFVLLLSLCFLYDFVGGATVTNTSDYVFLASADHTRIDDFNFIDARNFKDNTSAREKQARYEKDWPENNGLNQSGLFEPAIPTVPIGKFINGNLPTTTPDDLAGPFAPNLLSQTGAFSDMANLTIAPGFIPYEMIEPFWSDGAAKFRWMAIPNDGSYNSTDEQIVFSNDIAWDFPSGSVLIKHFELGGRRLETRFEVKGDDNVYYYLTYKWNEAQTDATLLNGAVFEDIEVNGVTQTWHYPSRAECLSCHFPQNGGVLGPKTRNLNNTITYPGGTNANQLVNLSEMGIIPELITNANVGIYMAVAAKDDLSASLEDRARSYIDVNCSSCHNPTVDNIAGFDARYTTPLEDQNIIYGDVNYDLGMQNPKIVIPQDVANSALHYRMNSTQANVEMPPIAKDVVDAEGLQLIEEWINSLSPTPEDGAIAGFTLIDATSDNDLFDLTNGLQIDPSVVEGIDLSIRTNTNPPVIGSVLMELSGPVSRTQLEGGAPYALFGDSTGGTNFNGVPFPEGSYTLTATAYDGRYGAGNIIGVSSVQFSIAPGGGGNLPPSAIV